MSITESIRKMTPNEAMCYDMGFENGIKVALETTSCITIDRLRELVAAERDGRVVVLPCKAGTSVWLLLERMDGTKDVIESVVLWWKMGRCEPIASCYYACPEVDNTLEFFASDFGKEIFLTRAEAEAAMKGATHDA